MKLTRIPLDVVVTATGERTPDVLVAVIASELDALELVASRLAEGVRAIYEAANDWYEEHPDHGTAGLEPAWRALAAYDDKVPDYGDPGKEGSWLSARREPVLDPPQSRAGGPWQRR